MANNVHLEIIEDLPEGMGGLVLEDDWLPTIDQAINAGEAIAGMWKIRGIPAKFRVSDQTGWVSDDAQEMLPC